MTVEQGPLGIQILLNNDTPIPFRIVDRDDAMGELREVKGKTVHTLTLPGAEASFVPGGYVAVRWEGQEQAGFQPLEVLEIRDLDGNLVRRNNYLCTNCMENSGKMIRHQSMPETAGLLRAVFECSKCSSRWELSNI